MYYLPLLIIALTFILNAIAADIKKSPDTIKENVVKRDATVAPTLTYLQVLIAIFQSATTMPFAPRRLSTVETTSKTEANEHSTNITTLGTKKVITTVDKHVTSTEKRSHREETTASQRK